jgi:hypothetical protein
VELVLGIVSALAEVTGTAMASAAIIAATTGAETLRRLARRR